MRAAIITLFGYFNYGQRLQNFAITKVLERKGYDVDTLRFHSPKPRNRYLKEFTHETMKVRYFSSPSIFKDYDLIIVGSDQVFNLTLKPTRFLNLIENVKHIDRSKLIAFAASFGINDLPDALKEPCADHFRRYDALSVRENRAAEIVEELIGEKPLTILDPVFFVVDDWECLARQPAQEKDYLFNYFVKGVNSAPGSLDLSAMLVARYNLEEVPIRDMPVPDFLGWLKHARLVLTNSYHGACFSIIFRVPFIYVENRAHLSSRIGTLSSKFSLQAQIIEDGSSDILAQEISIDVDYSDSQKIIAQEREKAMSFLRRAGV